MPAAGSPPPALPHAESKSSNKSQLAAAAAAASRRRRHGTGTITRSRGHRARRNRNRNRNRNSSNNGSTRRCSRPQSSASSAANDIDDRDRDRDKLNQTSHLPKANGASPSPPRSERAATTTRRPPPPATKSPRSLAKEEEEEEEEEQGHNLNASSGPEVESRPGLRTNRSNGTYRSTARGTSRTGRTNELDTQRSISTFRTDLTTRVERLAAERQHLQVRERCFLQWYCLQHTTVAMYAIVVGQLSHVFNPSLFSSLLLHHHSRRHLSTLTLG